MLRRLFPDKYNLGIFKARLTQTCEIDDRGQFYVKKNICHVFDVGTFDTLWQKKIKFPVCLEHLLRRATSKLELSILPSR